MLQYELLHLISSAIFLVISVFGGIHALRTLKMLYGTPEVLKSQRRIWVPILASGGFFVASGMFHLIEHFISYFEESRLISEYFLLVGLSLFTLSIYRYWRLQKEYSEIKHQALQRIK